MYVSHVTYVVISVPLEPSLFTYVDMACFWGICCNAYIAADDEAVPVV